MVAKNEGERLALAWIEGWIAGKPEEIPLAHDFTHSSPYGVVRGRERYLRWITPLAAENVSSLEIIRVLGGDDEAVIWFENLGPKGVVPTCDWVETKNGKIVAVTSFYDATMLR